MAELVFPRLTHVDKKQFLAPVKLLFHLGGRDLQIREQVFRHFSPPQFSIVRPALTARYLSSSLPNGSTFFEERTNAFLCIFRMDQVPQVKLFDDFQATLKVESACFPQCTPRHPQDRRTERAKLFEQRP